MGCAPTNRETPEMIPKKIHYCWFGNGAKNDLIEKCMGSWQELIPDYQIKEWNETNSPMDLPYVQEAYKKKLWSKVSNIVRLYAIYNEGGIYLDTDIEVIKNLDALLNNNCFLGFQLKVKHSEWVNNAVIGSIPMHPFIKKCMDLNLELFEKMKKFYISPEVTTKVLEEMGLRKYGIQMIGGVRLYPVEYFYPYPWWGKFHPSCVKEDTYCIHHWQVSWWKKKPRARKLRVRSWLYDKFEIIDPQLGWLTNVRWRDG
jgi:mannosyltransferase OCH1-like enzyme